MTEPKPDWRRRAERAERENALLRVELEKARRIYGDHLSEVVARKITIAHVRALLVEAIGEIDG